MAAALSVGPAAAQLGPGWAAYDLGRYAEAVAIWQPQAASGDADAAFGLAIAYDLGRGVEQDSAIACRWYARAADAGNAVAAFNAGVLHDGGRCGPRRAEEAVRWYASAAAAGFARAQLHLAQHYAVGDGVSLNPDQAAAWYRAAGAGGVAVTADQTRRPRREPGGVAGPLRPVTPTSPDDRQTLPGGDQAPITLAWDAPEQAGPARFLVELVAIEPSGLREVFARSVDVSALQVRLPEQPARYAWRVFAVGIDTPRYAAGPWQRFTIGTP